MLTEKLRDIVDFGSAKDINNRLKAISKAIGVLAKHIDRKSDLNAAILNIINRVCYYLNLFNERAMDHIELDAWISRNIFELLIVTKAILNDDDHLLHWMGQRVKDEVDICNELINMADGENNKQVKVLQNRITELNTIANQKGVELRKHFIIADISRKVGLEKEYLTNYKTLSKLTHPSSFAVNSNNGIRNSCEMKNRIIVILQYHLGILYKTIADFYNLDDSGNNSIAVKQYFS